jgi:hypothetical protein
MRFSPKFPAYLAILACPTESSVILADCIHRWWRLESRHWPVSFTDRGKTQVDSCYFSMSANAKLNLSHLNLSPLSGRSSISIKTVTTVYSQHMQHWTTFNMQCSASNGPVIIWEPFKEHLSIKEKFAAQKILCRNNCRMYCTVYNDLSTFLHRETTGMTLEQLYKPDWLQVLDFSGLLLAWMLYRWKGGEPSSGECGGGGRGWKPLLAEASNRLF